MPVHIVWSNENLDLEDWREDLEEEYPGYSDDKLYEIMCDTNASYLEDERANLNIQLAQPILVIAELGLWDGKHMGYKEIESGNIRDCLYSNYNSAFNSDSSYCLLASLEVLGDEGNFLRKADMENEKRALSWREFVESGFDGREYQFPDFEGTFAATFACKRWNKSRNLLVYLDLDDGRKIITATWNKDNFFGLADMPAGTRVSVRFMSHKKAPTNMAKLTRIERHAPTVRSYYFRADSCRDDDYRKAMNELVSFSFTVKNVHDDAADSLAMLADYLSNGIKTVSVGKRPF